MWFSSRGILSLAGWFAALSLRARPWYVLTDRRLLALQGTKPGKIEIVVALPAHVAKMKVNKSAVHVGAGFLVIPVKATGFDAFLRVENIADVDAVAQLARDVLLEGRVP